MIKPSVLAILFVLGCGAQSPPPSTAVVGNEQSASTMPSESECASAGRSIAKSAGSAGDRNKVTSTVTRRCTEDRWSRDAVACLANAPNDKGQDQCVYKHLTGEQKDKLEEAWNASAAFVMMEMTRWKDAMCQCTDSACAKDVSDRLTKWSEQFAHGKEPKLSEADQKRATEVGMAMAECMTRVMGMGTPGPAGVP